MKPSFPLLEINIPKIIGFQTTNSRNYITVSFNNMHTLKFKAQLTIKCLAVTPQLLTTTTECMGGNKIIEHSSDNETVLGSSRKLGGAAEHLSE